jgi:hypothetical protein
VRFNLFVSVLIWLSILVVNGCAFKKPSIEATRRSNVQSQSSLDSSLKLSWVDSSGISYRSERNLIYSEGDLSFELPISFNVAPAILEFKIEPKVGHLGDAFKMVHSCEAQAWTQLGQPINVNCIQKNAIRNEFSLEGISSLLTQNIESIAKIKVIFFDDQKVKIANSLAFKVRTLPKSLPSNVKGVWTKNRTVLYMQSELSVDSVLHLSSTEVRDPSYWLLGVVEIHGLQTGPTKFSIPTESIGSINRDFISYGSDVNCDKKQSTSQVHEQSHSNFLILPMTQELLGTWIQLGKNPNTDVTVEPWQILRLGIYVKSSFVEAVFTGGESSWKDKSREIEALKPCNYNGSNPYTTIKGKVGRDELEPSFTLVLKNIKFCFAQDLPLNGVVPIQVLEPVTITRPLRN